MIPNYWIFQGNPKFYRIKEALRDDAVHTWAVSAHKEKIKPGDRVILWMTGREAGCYALCEVISEVGLRAEQDVEKKYWAEAYAEEGASNAVEIKILRNLWNNPVYWSELKDLPEFEKFAAGNQGTNFRATEEQFDTILDFAELPSIPHFFKYAPGERAKNWAKDLAAGEARIHYPELAVGTLEPFDTLADLNVSLGLPPTNKSNKTWNLFLLKSAQDGDVVFASEGVTKVLGIGIIDGPYRYESEAEYPHVRPIRWLATEPWQYVPYLFPGYPELFRRDTFSPTLLGPKIIQEYLKTYPQYSNLFHEYKLYSEENPSAMPPTSNTSLPLNQILYGPPGTGKTYQSIRRAVAIADPEFFQANRDQQDALKNRFDALRASGQIAFVTFHQAMSYEDFIEGIKPETQADGRVSYEVQPGIFKRMAEAARAARQGHLSFEEAFGALARALDKAPEHGLKIEMKQSFFLLKEIDNNTLHFENSNGNARTMSRYTLEKFYNARAEETNDIIIGGMFAYYRALNQYLKTFSSQPQKSQLQNFVLVIDEINRGNIAAIFGELITLIETSKREGQLESLSVTLPYSKSPFSVPDNLYLIGTMNTADRSVEALDTALRRRFSFTEFEPDLDVLNAIGPIEGVDLTALLRAINERLEHLLDRDHRIGHSYFLDIKSLEDLKTVFQRAIIPLLQEYFYGDYARIGAVLGPSFLEKSSTRPSFPWKTEFEVTEEDLKPIYRFRAPEHWNFHSLYAY